MSLLQRSGADALAMHLETLKVFCDIVETRSFSTAASKNFVTQSAVSQQIRMLEQRYGRVITSYSIHYTKLYEWRISYCSNLEVGPWVLMERKP